MLNIFNIHDGNNNLSILKNQKKSPLGQTSGTVLYIFVVVH